LVFQIRKDKNYLLQCFRFIVNNNFLLEWPKEPLRFFEWTSNEEGEERKENVEAMLDQEEGDSDYESAGDEDGVAHA
jgi:hypothetical protein